MATIFSHTLRVLLCVFVAALVPRVAEATPVCVYPGASLACLDEVDSTPIGNKTPLIFIHGWNRRGIPGEPLTDTWSNLTAYFSRSSNAVLRSAFKLYEFRYYSNLVDVATLAGALRDTIDAHSDVSRARQVVFVTHSMGGLIGRYFLGVPQSGELFRGLPGGERTALVITLGTPHHGSPLANGRAVSATLDGASRQLWEGIHDLYFLRGDPGWWEVNRSDLRWDNFDQVLDYSTYASERNDLLEAMNADGRYDGKVIAYGGALGACSVVLHPIACGVNTIVANVFGVASDGFVPLSSALSYRTTTGDSRFRMRYLPDHDHSQIAEGKGDDVLFNQLKVDLLSAVGNTTSPVPSTCRIAQLPGNGGFVGELTDGDCLAPHRPESRADVYSLQASAGQRIRLTMDGERSPNGLPDPYLILVDPSGAVVAEDDDSGDGTNASIDYIARLAGRYAIEATAYDASGRGRYLLQVTVTNETSPPAGIPNVSGQWTLTRAGSQSWIVTYNRFTVTLIQSGSSLTGSILPVGNSRATAIVYGTVSSSGAVLFGSEHADWNGGYDGYFRLTLDSTLNRMTGNCGTQQTCTSATAVRIR